MKKTLWLLALVATAAAVAVTAWAASRPTPQVTATGNGSKCSLSSHRTFRLEEKHFRPNSYVRLKIVYGDNTDYKFPLKNGGKIKVDRHGDHTGSSWPCWPNKTKACPACGVSDKKTGYIAIATQLGRRPKQRPVYATTTFMVVP